MKNSKVLISVISVLIIYSIIGFIAIPKIAKPEIKSILEDTLTKKVDIQKVEFNPFLLKFSLSGFKIFDSKDTTFSFDKLIIDFSALKSIDEKHISFRDLEIINPVINIVQYEDGSLNLQKLVKETKEDTTKKEDDTKSSSDIKFQIYKTALKNAKIKFTKYSKDDKFIVDVDEFNYTFYDMGTYRNTLASHSLNFTINKHSKVVVEGGVRLSPFEMYGNVWLKNIKPTDFIPYEKDLLNFELSKNSAINLKIGYQVDTRKGLNIILDKGHLVVSDVNIKQKDNSILALNKLEVNNINLKYPQNLVSIDKISLDSLSSSIVKDENEVLNLTTLVNSKDENSVKEETTTKEEATKPWNVVLKEVSLKNSSLSYNDLKTKQKVDTSNINIAINNFKLIGSKIDLKNAAINNIDVKFDDKTNKLFVEDKNQKINLENLIFDNTLATVGSVTLENKSVTFKDLKNNMQVFTKPIKITLNNIKKENDDISIDKTSINSQSILYNDNKNQLKAVTNLLKIDLDNFNLKDTNVALQKVGITTKSVKIDELKSKTNIDSKNINLAVNKIDYSKKGLKVDSALVNKPFVSIILGKKDKEQKEEEKKEQETDKVAENKKSDFSFDIGPVNIKNMKMAFQDKNLPIPFISNITNLNGSFSRLNSQSSKPTELKLEGKVNKYGYTRITGIVDINDIKLLTNTNILFKNIAIKDFTPYSGKFVGRKIDSGKLNLDLKYNIKRSDLKAQNSVIISDIKLGEKVESPDAVSLPLDLAIALLEDSNGVIDIDLPVTGNVDDPQFSIAPIVWKVFTNLIVKAISSPFSLLASMLGIDEEKLKGIEFEYGQTALLASELESLDAIAKILEKKHRLAINIKPVYNSVKDTKAIQLQKIEKIIETQSAKIKKGDKYKIVLEELYNNQKEKKDLDEIKKQFTKETKDGKTIFENDEYVDFLKNELALKQEVTKEELVALSNQRITKIKEYLFNIKKISPEAIKIEEPQEITDPKAKWDEYELSVSTK